MEVVVEKFWVVIFFGILVIFFERILNIKIEVIMFKKILGCFLVVFIFIDIYYFRLSYVEVGNVFVDFFV